jgi:hypothetical protein
MQKTRTRIIQETLESDGVSRETARQAAVTIRCDGLCSKVRTERGSNRVFKAWLESVENGTDD